MVTLGLGCVRRLAKEIGRGLALQFWMAIEKDLGRPHVMGLGRGFGLSPGRLEIAP